MSIYSSTILSDGPLIYARFGALIGTTVADSSGNGNDGSYSGSCTPGVAGLVACDNNAALLFGGGTLSIPLSTCPSGNSGRSFELWIRTAQSDANYVNIFWSGAHTSGQAFECYLARGSGAVLFTDQSAVHSGSIPVNDGNVHHVVMTYDGSTLRTYIDAVLDLSPSYSAATASTTSLTIGTGDTDAFAGVMDEFAVYASALSPARVKAHYNAGIVAGVGLPVICAGRRHE